MHPQDITGTLFPRDQGVTLFAQSNIQNPGKASPLQLPSFRIERRRQLNKSYFFLLNPQGLELRRVWPFQDSEMGQWVDDVRGNVR